MAVVEVGSMKHTRKDTSSIDVVEALNTGLILVAECFDECLFRRIISNDE